MSYAYMSDVEIRLKMTLLIDELKLCQDELNKRADVGPAKAKADLERDCLQLVRMGMIIDAIKLYRQHAGVGLKEAKDAVDRLRAKEGI